MNLQPINPPLAHGQRVQCVHCSQMRADCMADLDAAPGSFWCSDCRPMVSDPVTELANAVSAALAKVRP